ncbi:MAG TPA: 3-deoxy-D-manno-octulosonic acid transferase [Deltaproteobacteria bacterium]|mgnify:CR=1 FL=1|nr:3-deoxy-D-manno-octulosonic acid transferase [Deltaproteobacteria bacterium]
MARILIAIYSILVSILMWPAGILLSRHPNFAGTILQRLGLKLPEAPRGRPLVWVHASSMGEVKAVSGLLKAIKHENPGMAVCLSTMTATGSKVASSIPDVDLVIPFPFDAPWVMRRYMLKLLPALVVIVETEIWPSMILAAEAVGRPVVIVNGRMTEKSFRRYSRIRPLASEILRRVDVLAMAESDGLRFSRLGAGKVRVLGNLKLDSLSEVDPDKGREMRLGLGAADRPVFIAGSIREGEEEAVFSAVQGVASRVPGLFAILAPRHPGQIGCLAELARKSSFAWCLKSRMEQGADLVIVDTMGELFRLYGASDAAFVGGSLVNLGGQNILEPIAWGVPTIHGPHMDNFTWALEVVEGCTIRVGDALELENAVVEALLNPEKHRVMAEKALALLEAQKGVTSRYVEALKSICAERFPGNNPLTET